MRVSGVSSSMGSSGGVLRSLELRALPKKDSEEPLSKESRRGLSVEEMVFNTPLSEMSTSFRRTACEVAEREIPLTEDGIEFWRSFSRQSWK